MTDLDAMDLSKKRQAQGEHARLRKVARHRQPPVRPSKNDSIDDISFKWISVGPWEHYRRETNVGPGAELVFLKKYPHTPAIMQQVNAPAEHLARLRPIVHRNIVQLHRVYEDGRNLKLVYEWTVASLKDILSFRPHWSIAETAAVCHGTLSALKYLHGTLNVSHGDLRVENIHFDTSGAVKLANTGGSLLHERHNFKDDFDALSAITRKLTKPKEGSDLQDFLRKLSDDQSASRLLEHDFLKRVEGPEQIQHCVWTWLATRLYFYESSDQSEV